MAFLVAESPKGFRFLFCFEPGMKMRCPFAFFLLLLLAACAPSAKMKNYDALRYRQEGNTTPGKVQVTFLGVSTLLIEDGETQLLMDGFVSRPGIFKAAFGKIKTDTALVKKVIATLHMRQVQAVFTAHSHYDHAMDAPYMAKYTGAGLYGSASTLNIGKGAGLLPNQLHPYQPGTELHFGKFTVVVLNSKHTPPIKVMGKSNDDLGIEIKQPLQQPAKLEAYSEGGAYDVLIKHHGKSMLIKASTNFIPHAFDTLHTDVLFLGIASLSKQGEAFRDSFYYETITALKPAVVIPIHWDNFFKPLSNHLPALPKLAGSVRNDLDYLHRRTAQDTIELHLMQGYDHMEW